MKTAYLVYYETGDTINYMVAMFSSRKKADEYVERRTKETNHIRNIASEMRGASPFRYYVEEKLLDEVM